MFPTRYLRRRRIRLAKASETTTSVYWHAIGSHMIIHPNTYFSDAYIEGVYEPDLVRYMKKNIRTGMFCIDIGANVGYFTLLMAQLVQPVGKVIAFEPTSRVFEMLKRNVLLNGLGHVEIERIALSDKDGTVEFHEGPAGFEVYNTMGRVTHPSAIHESFVASSVECERLDTYLDAHGLHQVDFVKIDVEGAELSVLSGMERMLKLNPQCQLVVEFADETTRGFEYSAREIGRWFIARGWRLDVIGRGGSVKPVAVVDQEWHGQMVAISR